jgi:hypothetical protein
MIRAVVVGAVLAAVLAALLVYALSGRGRQAASGLRPTDALRQLRLLDDAARLMSGMGSGMDPDRIDLLTDETRAAIADWTARYDRLRRDIDR